MRLMLAFSLALFLAGVAVGAEPAPPEGAAMSPKTRRVSNELKVAKNSLMSAVGACERPGTCDPQSRSADREQTRLLLQAEDRFMSVCQLCASREDCDGERQKMRDGKRSRGVAPCR